MANINERIKSLRIENDLTQKTLADIIGVKEVSFQRFEYGTRRPSLDLLIKTADYFNISLDYLVGRTDNPEINN